MATNLNTTEGFNLDLPEPEENNNETQDTPRQQNFSPAERSIRNTTDPLQAAQTITQQNQPQDQFKNLVAGKTRQTPDQSLTDFAREVTGADDRQEVSDVNLQLAKQLDTTVDEPLGNLQGREDEVVRATRNALRQEPPSPQEAAQTGRRLSDPDTELSEADIRTDPTLNAVFGPQRQDEPNLLELNQQLGEDISRGAESLLIQNPANIIRGETEDVELLEEGLQPGTARAVAGLQEGVSQATGLLTDLAETPLEGAEKGLEFITQTELDSPELESEVVNEFQRNLEESAQENREVANIIQRQERFEQEPEDPDKPFVEKLEDPEFVFEDLIAKNAPQLAVGLVGTALGSLGGPAGSVTGGLTTSFLQEGGAGISEAKEKLREEGREDLADNERFQSSLFLAQGAMAAPLETIGLEGVFRTNPLTSSIRAGMTRQFAREFTGEVLTAGGTESVTEMAQEVAANVTKRTFDKNQGLFEGVGAAGIAGLGLGGAGTTITGTVGEAARAIGEGRAGLSIQQVPRQPDEDQVTAETERGVQVTPPTLDQIRSESHPQKGQTVTQENINLSEQQREDITQIAKSRLQQLNEKDELTRLEVAEKSFLERNKNNPVALVSPAPTPDPKSDAANESRVLVSDTQTQTTPETTRQVKENIEDRILELERKGDLTPEENAELQFLRENRDNPTAVFQPQSPASSAIRTSRDVQAEVGEQQVVEERGAELRSEEEVRQQETGFLQVKIKELRTLISNARDVVLKHKARPLARFTNQNGNFPEQGSDTVFGQNGQDIVEHFGFASIERAQEAVDEYKSLRDSIQETNSQYRSQINSIKEELQTRGVVKSELNEKVQAREQELRELQNDLDISTETVRDEADYDPRWMTDGEYANYKERLIQRAVEEKKTKEAKLSVMETIRNKEFEKTQAIRKARGLPPIDEMTVGQLVEYNSLLQEFHDGAVFLTENQINALTQAADIDDVMTVRDAILHFLERYNDMTGKDVSLDEIGDLTPGLLERWTPDGVLAEKNPFYELTVLLTLQKMMEAEEAFIEIRDKVNELTRKANKSRDRGFLGSIGQFFIPQHKEIIDYLEADPQNQAAFAARLTPEELELANFIERYYGRFRDYLVKQNELKGSRFKDQYFTHVRRSFLEAFKEDGFMQAMREWWQNQREEDVIPEIVNQDTGEVMSKSKFFRYTLRRMGEIEPSQNVTRVFLRYVKMAERKKSLDQVIPILDVYTDSLQKASEEVDNGLNVGESLREFMNEWLNNKKGQRREFAGVKQNSKADIAIGIATTFVSLHFIGFNITAMVATIAGEMVMTLQAAGFKDFTKGLKRRIWDTGLKRLVSDKGKQIIDQAEPFIGRNVWHEISDPDLPMSSRIFTGIFGIFAQASVEANKIMLLGTRSKEEMQSGELNTETLANLKQSAARWRDLGANVRSIFSSTSVGKALTQFRTWAIPILGTVGQSMTNLGKKLMNDAKNLQSPKRTLTSQEAQDMARMISVSALVIIIGNVLGSEDDDEGWVSKITSRLYSESLTQLSAINPTTIFAVPPLADFLIELGDNLTKIAKLEQYKQESRWGNEGELKGLRGLQRQFTPTAVEQFTETNVQDGEEGGGLNLEGEGFNLDTEESSVNLEGESFNLEL